MHFCLISHQIIANIFQTSTVYPSFRNTEILKYNFVIFELTVLRSCSC